MQSLRNRSVAAFGAVIATAITFAAAAGPARAETLGVETFSVAHADLDLSTAQGQNVLGRRVRHAADVVCGEGDALTRFQVANCRARAVASAMPQVALNGGSIAYAGR